MIEIVNNRNSVLAGHSTAIVKHIKFLMSDSNYCALIFSGSGKVFLDYYIATSFEIFEILNSLNTIYEEWKQ